MYQLRHIEEITADMDYHAREYSELNQKKAEVEQQILALVSENQSVPEDLREKLLGFKSEINYHRVSFESSKNRLRSEVTHQVNSFSLPAY